MVRVAKDSSRFLLVTDSSLTVISANRLFWEFVDSLHFEEDFSSAELLCDELLLGLKLTRAVAQFRVSVAGKLEQLPETQAASQSIRRLSLLLDAFEAKNQEQGWAYGFRRSTELLKVRRDMLRAAFKHLRFGELDLWQVSGQLEKDAAPEACAQANTATWPTDSPEPRNLITSVGRLLSGRPPVRHPEQYPVKELQHQGHHQRKTV